MSLPAFLFAILALLLAPGPTNTLMALAGAQSGVARVVKMIPAEVAGYLATILSLAMLAAYVGGQGLAQWPVLGLMLKGAAALWVLLLAVRLWRAPSGSSEEAVVTAQRILLTTMLNPKALVFALVLLPSARDATFVPRLAVFIFCVVAVAMLWGGAGSLARGGNGRDGRGSMHMAQRLASVWLALVSMGLIAGMVRA